jgi:hypothetical protein
MREILLTDLTELTTEKKQTDLTGKHEADEIQEGTWVGFESFKIFPLPSSCISCPSCFPVKNFPSLHVALKE